MRAKKWTKIEPMIKFIIFKQIKLMKVKINISKAMGWHNMEKDNNILTIRNFKKIEILYIHAKMINLIINLDIGKKIFYIFFINYFTKRQKTFSVTDRNHYSTHNEEIPSFPIYYVKNY